MMTVVIILVFVFGWITDKYSWVDKLWSIVPVYYAWCFGTTDLGEHQSLASGILGNGISQGYSRNVAAASIISVWGVRLSYNFWRKGGYAWEGEDYRWPIIKERVSPFVFQVFNFVFISIIQNVLLLLLVSPLYVGWAVKSAGGRHGGDQFNAFDAAAIFSTVFFIIFESIADQQQWNFHQRKKANKYRNAEERKKKFLTSGLWRYSRHPNFFAEQAFWWSQCLFASAATHQLIGWWLVAPFFLSLLFQGSTDLTETISASKYKAEYAKYQKTTSRLFPMPPSL